MNVQDLFEKHGPLSFEKQLRLADLVGKSTWRFDLASSVLTFAEFSVLTQILGTVSEYSETWLWAWANEESNISPALLSAAGRLRDEFGLTEPEMDVTPLDHGHVLAMIAVGLLGAAAYYRVPYEGGAAFLLIPELPHVRGTAIPTNLDVISTFTQFISVYECNHKAAYQSYAAAKGNPPIETVFDSKGRLVKIEARIA